MNGANLYQDRLSDLTIEQRELLFGGSLSQRFSKLPLSLSHPAIISAFYAFLVSLGLFLPLGYEANWVVSDWLGIWGVFVVILMLLLSILGQISLFMNKITRRLPIHSPRKILYRLPFLGLLLISAQLSLLEGYVFILNIGVIFLIIPGPIYVHLSWAPRWRMLVMLDEGIEPFTDEQLESTTFSSNEDIDVEEVVDELV